MRKVISRAVVVLGVALLGFGVITWYALEGVDVAILRTRAPDGSVRETHVWVAGDGDDLLLEAATPERGWLYDVVERPEVELEYAGATANWHALPEPGVDGHERIRALLRAKYGWADRWVALLQDTSASVAVRLRRSAR